MTEVITRESYQVKRLRFVKSVVDVFGCRGLEIGACDLPTVPGYVGSCEYADFRSAEEMIRLWSLPPGTVVPVDFILNREQRIHEQIEKRFDYVIACHVIEHVANPIGYIQDMQKLLAPDGAGVIVLAVPDKRCTSDTSRLSTTLDHLLMDFHDNSRIPSLEHILDFGRVWSPVLRSMSERSMSEYYQWAVNNLNSGQADAHCHVWMDSEFIGQMERVTGDGFLPDLTIAATEATPPGFNEFMIAFHNLPHTS